MAARGRKVIVDTSKAERDLGQLAAAITAQGPNVGRRQAARTAPKIRGYVPVLTGALRNTVTAVPVDKGGGVTYGGGLRYAGFIERTRHPVRRGARGSRTEFFRAMKELADMEVRRV